jgi:hypothetical protein
VAEGWPDGVDPVAGFEAFGAQVQAFFAWQDPEAAAGSLADFAAQDARRMAYRAAWRRYFQDIVDMHWGERVGQEAGRGGEVR